MTVRETRTSLARQGGDPRTDVNGQAADVVNAAVDVPGIHARPKLEAERAKTIDQRQGTSDGPSRTVGRLRGTRPPSR